jgi:hypothetical protein
MFSGIRLDMKKQCPPETGNFRPVQRSVCFSEVVQPVASTLRRAMQLLPQWGSGKQLLPGNDRYCYQLEKCNADIAVSVLPTGLTMKKEWDSILQTLKA